MSLFDDSEKFRDWIDDLDNRVIQQDNGFEKGEFSVFADHWEALYKEGLTPDQAWKRAIDAHSKHAII